MGHKESRAVRFLYQTIPGRVILKLLIQPTFSKLMVPYLTSPLSKWLISYYIQKFQIDLSSYPKKSYRSFNDFFTRERFEISKIEDRNSLIAPCDSFLSVYPITADATFWVKHIEYDLETLLRNRQLAENYCDGDCLIFRLAPYHYHRYIYTDSGNITAKNQIPGVLHCVRPDACSRIPVYIMNTREYTCLQSDHFGDMVQMEVGALLVGRIQNHQSNASVCRYQEKGFFEFGGSTIILLFEKGKIMLDETVRQNVKFGKELAVKIGQKIGTTAKQEESL